MTGIVTAGADFGALIGDALASYALISTGQRSIGDLYPHVVVEETHHDEMAITEHPIETGAPITDHAFNRQPFVEIRCGWSNSTAASEGYVQAVYRALLDLQSSRTPFNVSTGKRQYSNMLMASVMVRTDVESEYALNVVGVARQITITSTQTTGSSSALTDGSSSVASQNTDGSFTVSGGAAAVTSGEISAGSDGTYGFSNSPFTDGSQILSSAPSGTPTVEDLLAAQGEI